MAQKIVVGVTGASGAVYAKVLLDKLQALKDKVLEVGVVMSDNARQVWELELGNASYKDYPFRFWDKKDFHAPFASGSAGYRSMLICPCSMGTMGRIASGVSDDLMTRAADVMLKERGRLVLVPRETPFNLIHVQNLEKLILAGASICPANPSFYSKPLDFEALAATVVDRALSLVGLDAGGYRWGESPA